MLLIRISRAAAILAGLLLASAGVRASAPAADVVVSAAASLTDVLQQIQARYRPESGERVVLNVGASNALARQINAGARVDLFISADETQMNAVSGEIVPGTRIDLLSNQLAIVVPDDSRVPLRSARDLVASSIRRIAIGDPAAVPAGVYAKAFLQQLGIWQSLEPRLVPSLSVRAALGAVEAGAVDAAIVYRTDAQTARRARTAVIVPRAEGPRIAYPAAVLRTGSNQPGARRLLAYLRTQAAADVFRAAGFVPLRDGRR